MANSKLHTLLLRQLNKICKNGEKRLEENENFEKFLHSISKTYEEYDQHSYTLERSLELSFEELETLQLKEKSSYETRLKAMVEAMPDMMFLTNEEGVFLEAFSQKDEVLFPSSLDIIGKNYDEVFPKELEGFFCTNLKKTLINQKLNIVEFMLESEKQYYEARFISANYLIEGKETVISIIRNISSEKKIQKELKYIALHDDLTKLPNRFYFQKQLKETLKEAKKKQFQGALFFLDIDQFKIINDNLGHNIGDKILLKITKRLKKVLNQKYFLARFGGDEFVIIVDKVSSIELRKVADLVMEQFVKPFKVDKYSLDMTTSMGICTFPDMISSSSQLLKQADIAMYKAKSSGRNRYKFFTRELAEKAYDEFSMEVNLKKAITNNEFYLLYQPQIQLNNNKLIGVEALIRWKSHTLISPDKFVPIAERCGFIDQISDWVIEEVCKQIKRWEKEKIITGKVAINLSRRELGKKNLLSRIMTIIEKYKISTSAIEFEVTETAVFANRKTAFKNITTLREKGFSIAIDDFGTGYSSLSNLKEFLFDKLKIDRSFIQGIGHKKESELIVKATIAIAESLKLKVIAEGVETYEQLAFLEEQRCNEVQGYYFSRPVSASDISSFYANFHINLNRFDNYQI
ncbi:MAG: diguanylate cyclase/phosphodiesterase (GGDEF & EAL domains) with PAS/PAC sensor(s) [uncultured Sulfurovum sp.]|uniref:Diguanylate cyclase/phosphodiesterase (GGDEF & EAL domains) with PAS/PAC sensor(S) n=1 Tax=uncultured Sulfurovum sp. TaxID=269237 RepID=A0A6S6SRI4_9BACT|nr:MAG: diguanylate cyclase/phosphodiesterase (GGDEF & EAL domains) with PAS/PAC sensor(s) [uncultured Sulfurovum sp.]